MDNKNFLVILIIATIYLIIINPRDAIADELYRLDPDENAITANGNVPLHVEITLANLTNSVYNTITEPIDNVTFWFSSSGSPTDEIYVQLYKSDYSTFVAESNHISVSSISSYTPITFIFSDSPVCGSVTCYFKIYRTGSGGVINLVYSNININGSEIGTIDGWNIGTGYDDGVYLVFNSKPQEEFYSEIKNTPNGTLDLKDTPQESSENIKTLPQDWVVRVNSTIDKDGDTVIADEYKWYQITDPTDGVSGWMMGHNMISDVGYLSYISSKQSELFSVSSDYVDVLSRPGLILEAFEHYYNNTENEYSLYSSNDGSNNISSLKDKGFEEKVLLGIAAQESGGIDFDNEYVSYDYGHGIMQITFDSRTPNTWDNRGVGSMITIPRCASVGATSYNDCYGGDNPKYYKPYEDNSTNPTYKQYTNTKQSIYSNIKDGLKILQYKYGNFYPITENVTINGTTYSPKERGIILATAGYNGSCLYVNDVANRLDNIGSYFPNVNADDISVLIQKMHTAENKQICVKLHSPVELIIQDSYGKKVGSENGELVNNFPMAIYDKSEKFAKILSPEDENYEYKVQGTNNGIYSMDITIKNGEELYELSVKNIPIITEEVHIYSVDTKALSECKDGVKIKVDGNGDGRVDRVLKSETTLTEGTNYNSPINGELKVSSNKNKCKKSHENNVIN